MIEWVRRKVGGVASPKNLPKASSAVVYTGRGRISASNVRLFRNWAENGEWVRAAINLRKDQVSQAEWQIEPIDPTKPFSVELQRKITERLATPNPRDKTLRSVLTQVLEDHLVLDAGCAEFERNLRGEIAYIWPLDAAQVEVNKFWDGNPEEKRYYWVPDGQQRGSWYDRDFMLMMGNEATYRVIGLSPLETLKRAIDSELGTSDYNDRQMRAASPDGMLDLGENARPDQVDEFKVFWANEVMGKGTMAIVGGSRGAKFVPFRMSNRDMQFLEWQTYLVKKICAVFKLSPQDLGFTEDINRANGDVAQENTEDRGLRPLLGLIQDIITGEIVHDEGFGGPSNNLMFHFTQLNLRESMSQAKISQLSLAGIPWQTVDEVRIAAGLPPIGGKFGKMLCAMASNGPVWIDEDTPSAREVHEASKKPDPAAKPPAGKPDASKVLVAAGVDSQEG